MPRRPNNSRGRTTSPNITGRLPQGKPIPYEYRDPDIDKDTESEGHTSSPPSSPWQVEDPEVNDINEPERRHHQGASHIAVSEDTSSDQQYSSAVRQPQPQPEPHSTTHTRPQSRSQTQSATASPSQHQAGSTSPQTTSQPPNTTVYPILSPENSSLVRSHRDRRLQGHVAPPLRTAPPAPQRPSRSRCTNCINAGAACDGFRPCGRCGRLAEWEESHFGSRCRHEYGG